jgi:ketosteroid isomerase-like protein
MKMITRLILLGLFTIAVISCERNKERIADNEFKKLIHQLAESWTNQDVNSALECFEADAVYMQPPAEQFYKGQVQLRAYFGAIKEGTIMKLHNVWFDHEKQLGAVEFTFANTKSGSGVTGVAIVLLEKGKIKHWREYFISGPIDFDEFISTENKDWKWHIGNYP